MTGVQTCALPIYFVEFGPTTIIENDYAYMESINSFMHVDHDKSFLWDSYIFKFYS